MTCFWRLQSDRNYRFLLSEGGRALALPMRVVIFTVGNCHEHMI